MINTFDYSKSRECVNNLFIEGLQIQSHDQNGNSRKYAL